MRFLCLSVCHSLGRPENESVMWQLVRMAGLREAMQVITVLSTVEAQLPLLKHNIVKEPQKHGNAKKMASEVRNIVAVLLCPISELHAPVES